METLQRWLNSKGDNAATALAAILRDLGLDPEQLVAAVEAEQLKTEVEDLRPRLAALAARGVDLAEEARKHANALAERESHE